MITDKNADIFSRTAKKIRKGTHLFRCLHFSTVYLRAKVLGLDQYGHVFLAPGGMGLSSLCLCLLSHLCAGHLGVDHIGLRCFVADVFFYRHRAF